jgi:hypothetical protein
MCLAAVVGGECACGTAGKGVEQDCERQREQALRDSYGQSGRCLREVAFEAHLAFQVAKTLSITSRLEASERSRRSLAGVRSFAGVRSAVPQLASRAR